MPSATVRLEMMRTFYPSAHTSSSTERPVRSDQPAFRGPQLEYPRCTSVWDIVAGFRVWWRALTGSDQRSQLVGSGPAAIRMLDAVDPPGAGDGDDAAQLAQRHEIGDVGLLGVGFAVQVGVRGVG
jgi:hypothetical protein